MWNSLLPSRRKLGRRAAALLIVAAVVGLPAVALRATCAGNSCRSTAEASSNTPFCSLPSDLRKLIEHGYYDGRAPDIIAVTGRTLVGGGDAFQVPGPKPLWPTTSENDSGRVPIVFSGSGLAPSADVPAKTRLDAVAETLADVIGLSREHPEVRSGETIAGLASGETPRLVLQVVLKGIRSEDLEQHPSAWPVLRHLMGSGAGTLDGMVGSLPLDPAASLATIGTGGLPYQHGTTGSLLRRDEAGVSRAEGKGFEAKVVTAWSKTAPRSVIATLGDDLDQTLKQRPIIGLVGTDPIDRGLIGGNWYVGGDRDRVVILDQKTPPVEQAGRTAELLRSQGFGKDQTPDLVGVVLSGRLDELDASLSRLIRAARTASGGSFTTLVTATGRADPPENATVMASEKLAAQLGARIDVEGSLIEALALGGIYLDQQQLARFKLSDDIVLQELLRLRTADGVRVMADAFPSIAITFGRYC